MWDNLPLIPGIIIQHTKVYIALPITNSVLQLTSNIPHSSSILLIEQYFSVFVVG